jgi:hypothetical protein
MNTSPSTPPPKSLFRLSFCIAVTIVFTGVSTTRANLVTNLPVADTAIDDRSPDENKGTFSALPVGVSKDGSAHNRGLFKFDLSNLPPNAVIQSATLRFTVVMSGTLDSSYDVNRLLVDWGETNATWNNRLDATPWAAPGAQPGTEYIINASATADLLGTGLSTDFTSAGLVSDVQMWVNHPGTNFGWILIATGDAPATGKQVGSRENPGNTPLLIIQYTAATPPPTPPVITNTTRVGNQFQFAFNAQSNHTYTVQFVGSPLNTNWATLSNVPSQPAATLISISDTLTPSNRFYRVRTP